MVLGLHMAKVWRLFGLVHRRLQHGLERMDLVLDIKFSTTIGQAGIGARRSIYVC